MNEQREIQTTLYKMSLEANKEELDGLDSIKRGHAEANLKAKARVAARKIIKENNKITALREELTPEGITWKYNGNLISGYYDNKLLFEIKRGVVVFNLYENKKYKGCSTNSEKLKDRAMKLFNENKK